MARAKADVLNTAILGLLSDAPLHGYELRKQLNGLLGSFRALSYGSLYPALKNLASQGFIRGLDLRDAPPHALSGKRARIVYELTADGKEYLQTQLATAGPSAWEDESFDVRFALFSLTDPQTRVRILEGRRSRLTERLEELKESAARARGRLDEYSRELQRHGLEQVEREVHWIDNLIENERGAHRASRPSRSQKASGNPSDSHDSPAVENNTRN